MNQTTESSEGVPFVTNSLNIQTTGDNTIEIIDHELIIEKLPLNDPVTNNNMITTDAFNRLYNSPISSIPASNPFDQDLNSFNQPEFQKLGINMPITDGSSNLAVLKLRNTGSPNVTSWGCRTEYYLDGIGNDDRPYMSINLSRPIDQNITMGSYWNGVSWISSDDLSSFKWQRQSDVFNFNVTTGPQTKGANVVNEKAPCYVKANTDIGFYIDGNDDGGLYFLAPDVSTTNTNLLSHNSITNKTELLNRSNIWGQDLLTSSSVQFSKLSFPNAYGLNPIVESQMDLNKNGSTAFTINSEGSQYPGISISDKTINTPGMLFGMGAFLDTSSIMRASDTQWVILKRTRNLGEFCIVISDIPQTPGDIITGGDIVATFKNNEILFDTDFKANTTLSVGPQTVTPTTTTSSQLKVSGPPGDLGPYPKTDLGGRIEIYNDGNQYPLLAISAFRPNDQAIVMGAYGATDEVWRKSDTNYWKFQRNNSTLGLYCNSTTNGAGSTAVDKTVIEFRNDALSPSVDFKVPVVSEKISIPNPTQLNVNVNSQVEINRDVISTFSINADGGQYPKLTISDKDAIGGGQQVSFVSFGAYNKNDAVGSFTSSDTAYIAYERKHGSALFTFFGGVGQTPGNNVTDFQVIQDIGVDQIKFYKKVIIDSVNVNNSNTRLLSLNGSNEVQETAISSLNFNDLQLGDQTPQTTETTSQLRIVRPAVSGGLPSTDGSALQLYIDTNIYPKYEELVLDTNKTTISYGAYHNNGSVDPVAEYFAGSNNFFQWRKEFDELKLFKSSGVQSPGTPISAKEIMRFRDLEMRLLAGYGLQVDNISETTSNAGVSVSSWSIKSQNITSDGISDVLNPLSINLKYSGDSNIPMSMTANAHDDLGINLDCHVNIGVADSYISGSVLGNVILDKNDDMLRVLVTNGNLPGAAFSKSAMNSVLEVGKTFVHINEPATFSEAILANGLTSDPETQPETILLTQSSLTNELFRRPYKPVYGTATAINAGLILALPIINTYVHVTPGLAFGSTLKNCTVPIGDEIVIDSGISTFEAQISYTITLGSGVNPAKEYVCAVQITSSTVTASQMSIVTFDSTQRSAVSCSFIATLTALDTVGVYIKNVTDTASVNIEDVTLTVNKIFE
jgi:hypothetical protein